MAVYFIYNPLNHRVRIGRSKQVKHLLNTLRMNSGVDMELMGVIADDTEETNLHVLFRDNHVRGEWYELTKEMETHIRNSAVDPATLESPWTTVRLPQSLYNQLVAEREKTGMPASTAVRVAIERYLEGKRDKAKWLVSSQYQEWQKEQAA